MKNLLFTFLLCVCLGKFAQAQTYPKNPNKTDAKGLRQGKWTILYDAFGMPNADEKKTTSFRTIEYKDVVLVQGICFCL